MNPDRGRWHDAIAADFLEAPVADVAAPFLATDDDDSSADAAGQIIGRYRLIREIGRGGMGRVWLAERADGEFEQHVALKLIKRGMDSDEILARFRRERQILALLEHANVARLLDGGVSEDGRPYFAMEYVQGTPITANCDARHLDIDERLRLFLVVCRAVHYAHQNLVVHRDIKPSNVLVTDDGTVKLLDFGVAKLLEHEAAVEVSGVETRKHPLTPAYASPEQLAGERVTTTSDIYQLGVLLHELLTGARPQQQTTDPRRRLRGDLETIARRALRPEPDRRYPSAAAMADDIERHLAHLPIRYGGDARSYRVATFIRRNRVKLAVGTLFVATIVTMATAYVMQVRRERDRAQREAAKASETAALLYSFFRGWNVDAADRGKVSAEKLLNDAELVTERELLQQPASRAASLSLLGDLHTALGQPASADSLFGQALSIQERLGESYSADFATTLYRRGKLYNMSGRYEDAEAVLRRALTVYRSLLPLERANGLRAQLELAMTLYPQQKYAESERLLRDALARSADNAPFATEVSAELGYVLFLQARYRESSTMLRQVLADQRRIFGPLSRQVLRTARAFASSLRDRESLKEAEALGREALTIAQTLFGDDHFETYFGRASLAVLLERKGDFVEAQQLAELAVRRAISLFGEANLNSALMLRTNGSVALARDQDAVAEALLRRALAAFRQAFPHGHADEADVLNRLAYILVKRGAPDATAIYHQAVEFDRARPANEPIFITDGYEYLGWAAEQMGDTVLASTLLRRAVTLYDGELPEGHVYRRHARQWLEGLEGKRARG